MGTLEAFLFGLTLALAIGPIALLIVNYGLTRGVGAAVRSAFGAAIADLGYALVAFTVGGAIAARLEAHADEFRLIASCLLAGFGLWMMASTWREPERRAVGAAGARDVPSRGERGEFVTTFLLTAVNPLTILIFVSFAGRAGGDGTHGIAAAVRPALAVFAGSLMVQLLLALTGGKLRDVIRDPRWIRVLNLVSAAGIVAFGVAGVLSSR